MRTYVALQEAAKFMEDNLDEKISQRLLCKKTGLNACQFKKNFKELFKISSREYHVQLKMEKGKKLLRDTDEKISSIAYVLGYEYPGSFTLEFRRRVGIAPGKWRRSHVA